MNGLLVVSIVVATLFLAGQWYLHSRRRKAGGLLARLARGFGASRRGNRIDLMVGSHRVVLDAQMSRDDRPEELRLTIESGLPGEFRLTLSDGATHYADCRHTGSAAEGAPFAGWHVHSEDPGLMIALSADRRVRELVEGLAALGFSRLELAKTKLRALWPDFSWQLDARHREAGDIDELPGRVRRAAEKLSELATAAGTRLRSTGRPLHGSRVRATLTALLLVPLLTMVAGIPGILFFYDAHPTVRDDQLLALMSLAGTALAAIYTMVAHRLLRNSVQRVARTAVVGLVSVFGFCLGSAAPILWWNGTGPQGPGQRLTVEVVRLQKDSALVSGRGRILRKVIGKDSRIEEWSTTYRAIVRSWRDDSLYGVSLNAEQFSALPPGGGRVSLTVFPGALGLEWYSDVVVVAGPELPDRRHEVEP